MSLATRPAPSPKARRKVAPADDDAPKRRAILDAALVLFAERGFHGTAVPHLAEEAKVGAGTVYRYFESKEAIVNELYRREKKALFAFLLEGFSPDASPRAGFTTLFRRLIDFSRKHPKSLVFLELHHHGDYLDDESHALEELLAAPLEAYLVGAQQAEAVKPVAPRLLMAIVWGAFIGILRASWLGHIKLTPKNLEDAEVALWEAIRR